MFSDKKIRELVGSLMDSNLSKGFSTLLQGKYCYIKPSSKAYTFQWFWDTCFHIYILCALKRYGMAKENLISLFAMQEQSGFVGHMIFWESSLPRHHLNVLQAKPTIQQLRPHMSSLIQPSLVAQSLERIFKDTRDHEFLEMMLPKLKKYFEWLSINRDFDGDGLISIISPFESGIDWKPSFDEVIGFREGKADWQLYWRVMLVEFRNFILRYDLDKIREANYFVVKETVFNTLYALDLYAMSRLLNAIGDRESRKYKQMAEKVSGAIMSKMYDDVTGAFYDISSGKKLKVLTAAIFFPLALKNVPDGVARKVMNHLKDSDEFALPYPVPSIAASEPAFDPEESKFLWRGPTWVFFNWFLFRVMKTRGNKVLAANFLDAMRKLVEKSGFREYFNPYTGEGYGARDFTWIGLVLDMLREEAL